MKTPITSNIKNITAVDLFCGAGGLTHGLEKVGIDVVLGIDTEPACEYPYTTNNNAQFLLKSVEDINGKDLMKYYEATSGFNLLAGCAPCQTFSAYNPNTPKSDKRWGLLGQFFRLIKESKPDLIAMENVPRLINQNIFKELVDNIQNLGYFVDYAVINCADFGVPQTRRRLIMVASRIGVISLLTPKQFGAKPKTLRDAIANMSHLLAGERCSKDPLHRAAKLSDINMARMKASIPGGTWRDWPEDLIIDCHKKPSGQSYACVYGRMSWDQPASTITTQFYGFGNGRFGHPEQDRAISLREGAILQTFPLGYSFSKNEQDISRSTISRLIGNAVPVRLGEVIGKSLLRHLSSLDNT